MLAAVSAGLSAFTVNRELGPHDEGLMLQAGARIAAGQWPYRNFRLNYPPGQPMVLAALHKAIGPSLLSWRVMRPAVDAWTSDLALSLACRQGSKRLSFLAWVATAGAMAFPTGPGPNPPAQALALAALLRARERPRQAAMLAGLATLFRLEVGAAAGAGTVIAAPRPQRGAAAATWLAVAGGALAPFVARAPGEMFEDTVGFFAVQRMQRLPFPVRFGGPYRPSKLVEFYAPAILVAGVGVSAFSLATGRDVRTPQALSIAPLALVGAGYLLARTDEFHLVPLASTLPVLLAELAATERRPGTRRALVAALSLIALHGLDRKAGQALHPPALAEVPGPVGCGAKTSPGDARDLESLRTVVHELTAPGEAIFVANPRHDLVRVGDPLLYVLLERPNATRYDVMQPGVVTTDEVQREIVRSLASTRLIVRWDHPTACEPEPNEAGRTSGSTILDSYLSATFREHSRHGNYSVLVRDGDESPAVSAG